MFQICTEDEDGKIGRSQTLLQDAIGNSAGIITIEGDGQERVTAAPDNKGSSLPSAGPPPAAEEVLGCLPPTAGSGIAPPLLSLDFSLETFIHGKSRGQCGWAFPKTSPRF